MAYRRRFKRLRRKTETRLTGGRGGDKLMPNEKLLVDRTTVKKLWDKSDEQFDKYTKEGNQREFDICFGIRFALRSLGLERGEMG